MHLSAAIAGRHFPPKVRNPGSVPKRIASDCRAKGDPKRVGAATNQKRKGMAQKRIESENWKPV